jgi:MFS family permease
MQRPDAESPDDRISVPLPDSTSTRLERPGIGQRMATDSPGHGMGAGLRPGMGGQPAGVGLDSAKPSNAIKRTFSALADRNYRILWSGMMLQMGGMQVQMLARGYFIYELTDSKALFGLVLAVSAIPAFAFALFGGVLADRVDKKRLIQIGQVIFALLALFVALSITTDTITWQHLLVASVLHGSVMPFVMPARMAIIPQVVGREGLMNAIAVNSMGMSAMTMGAPVAAGFFIKYFGIEGLYYIIVGMYVASVLITSLLPRYENSLSGARKAVLSDIGQGFRYVRANSVIIVLILLGFTQVLMMMPIRFIMPVFAKDVFSVEADGLGTMMLFLGIGSLGGAAFIAWLGRVRRRGLLLAATGIASGTLLLSFAAISFFAEGAAYSSLLFAGALVVLVIMGMIQAGRQTMQQSLVMEYVEQEYRGRIMSINMLGFGIMPLGILPLTFGAEILGSSSQALGLLAVVFIVISALILVTSRQLRQLH